MVALEALLMLTKKLSFVSTEVSPMTATMTVFVVCPGVKVSVPLADVKSAGAVAVPSAVV